MKKAIGYVRVSTDKQAEEGISIDAQIAKIKAWASLNDYELVHLYSDEGISGASLNKREGMLQALASVKKGMAFICYSLSRISRDTIDTIQISRQIEKAGADLVSLSEKIDTTGASGKMIFNMLAVLNQFERDQTAERTKFAMQFKKSRNQAYSPIPYGYERHGDELVINISEALTIIRIKELFEAGKGYGEIATILNKEGIPTKQNKRWYRNTVYYVLQRSNVTKEIVAEEQKI
ncbi:recombinase family protein [Acinetobacter nosocomialis]|uniref:recombinase family protein n=1 Tax=Acinetobacter calcoaceticus/baumannii complex TaxID=909768 RepID=UPI00233EC298|nr:recombinase family protein [Acinetobacter baumannii]HCA5286881.1 recombinase family protein [Acinetobacter nosocomialis]MDC5568530.1 recombinase family protein [Acinetobacter baumannii]MDK2172865.1 recombinase family protein [Acinetobacter baumannii]MDK2183683.1 recombinase family protein [Acinetobacter baumannii]MDK2329507.1 recombinase family protein [Acinetobacter baumannii]